MVINNSNSDIDFEFLQTFSEIFGENLRDIQMLMYNKKMYISYDDLCNYIDVDYETEDYENLFVDYIDIFENEKN